MAIQRRTSGISLSIPDGMTVEDLGESPLGSRPSPARRGRRNVAPAATEASPLIQALRAEDVELLDSFSLSPAAAVPAGRRRAGTAPDSATQIRVDVEPEEQAVLLVEQDGVYAWRLASQEEAAPPSASRRRSGAAASRRLVFDLGTAIEDAPAPARRRTRGPVVDALAGKVRAWVFKWVARRSVGGAVKLLERNVHPGLLVIKGDDPAAWRYVDSLDAIKLPKDRMPRILLFVHGTFSSTRGSFGALAASAPGRSFLADANREYDAVVGFDHATLSETPLSNANQLLRLIQPALEATGARIDAVAYSRGALVLRSLIEYLLPTSLLKVRVGRAIFVGGTNGGTQLANPDNWNRLVDLYTNLAVVGSRALQYLSGPMAALVLKEAVATLGALVRHLAEEIVDRDGVPGLAAMDPRGDFVREINATQPGQPIEADAFYYVVRSDFDVELLARGDMTTEFPQRLAKWVVDSFADQLLGEPNDLVVHLKSMVQIDSDAGDFVRDRLDFEKNPHVYHTNYFTQPELMKSLRRWLELREDVERMGFRGGSDRTAERLTDTPVPAAAETNLLVVNSQDAADDVVQQIRAAEPSYVVVERSAGDFWYAFEPNEIVHRAQSSGNVTAAPLEILLASDDGFRLGEDRVSKRRNLETSTEIAEGTARVPMTGRTIVFRSGEPVGVIPGAPTIVPSSELASGGRMVGTLELSELRPAERSPVSPVPRRRTRGRSTREPGRAARDGDLATHLPSDIAVMAAPPEPTPLPAAKTTCYVGASTSTPIGKDEDVPLNVTLSREQIVLSLSGVSAVAETAIDYSRKLVIQVVGIRNIEIVGDSQVDLDPSQINPRAFVAFTIRGTNPGEGEVWAILRQGPVSVATVVLKPEIVLQPSSAKRSVRGAAEGTSEPLDADPYPLLQIFETQKGTEVRYLFNLTLPDGSVYAAESNAIIGDRAAYVDAMYKEIEDRWVQSNDDVSVFEEELRSYGATLLDELVPDAIVARLWDLRDELRAIHVMSAEPFIPWEIVHLKAPRPVGGQSPGLPAEMHFLAQKGLVRWLHNFKVEKRLRIRPGKAWYTIPNYPYDGWGLPAAQEEIPFLEQTFKARPVPPPGTPPPHGNLLRDLLRRKGEVDLFHFSGHGEAQGTGPTRARILLLGPTKDLQNNDVPEPFASTTVANLGSLKGEDGTRPIVFLNACQIGRQNWNLTSIGGFAEAFLRIDAGAFIGSLWSVGDWAAADFGKAFYQALVDGKLLAEAAVAGRDAARAEGEATWLAYVIYGHPHARLTVGADT